MIRRFQTSGPPAYKEALLNYISYTYPAHGKRPSYTDYDLILRFVEGYVPYLYTSVSEALAIRLLDGQGRPVTDDGGQEVLIPVPEEGPEEKSSTIWAWEQIHMANVANNCVDPLPPPTPVDTVLRLAEVNLEPNSQYTAILVSNARPQQALATWGFTTSHYATFTDLVTREREVAPSRIATGQLTGQDFDTCARAIGVETVAYLDHFKVTPILTFDATACAALLLESPEPLEADTRLSVTVDTIAGTPIMNVDGTRVLLIPPTGTFALGDLSVHLTWRRNAGSSLPTLAIRGDTSDEVIDFVVHAGGPI
jgi:hypothetical protein